MQLSRPSSVVVGIDVGGSKKGFHAVALAGGKYRDRMAYPDVAKLVSWCANTMQASVIAVDAPCRWRVNKEGRLAERELMRAGIWCFSTPTRTAAITHQKGYYEWMLRGEELYKALRSTHPVCEEWPPQSERYSFETFPHAITWYLRGCNADAKRKRTQRRQLLEQFGIALDALTHIDWLDAALCALTAAFAASRRRCKTYGEVQTGFIVVPTKP